GDGEASAPVTPATAAEPQREADVPPSPQQTALECTVPRAVALEAVGRRALRVPAGAEVGVTADDARLAGAVERHPAGRGCRPRLVACGELARLVPPETLGGLVVLAPVGQPADELLGDALLGLRNAGPALRAGRGMFATVARLDGAFGLAGLDPGR